MWDIDFTNINRGKATKRPIKEYGNREGQRGKVNERERRSLRAAARR